MAFPAGESAGRRQERDAPPVRVELGQRLTSAMHIPLILPAYAAAALAKVDPEVTYEVESLGAPYFPDAFQPTRRMGRWIGANLTKPKAYKGSPAAKRATRRGGNPGKRRQCAS